MTRVRERYQNEAVAGPARGFGYTNIMAVPKITKVVVNMGLGEATSNAKIIDVAADELARVTGQKAVTRRAKSRSRSSRCVRDAHRHDRDAAGRADVRVPGSPDRHRAAARARLPRISPKGFDGRGNYTLGLKDQLIFPEIDYMKVDKTRGMNISVVTTAKTDEEARKLLQLVGFPFQSDSELNMATTAKIAKEERSRSLRCGGGTAASCAAVRGRTCASSRCAVCASGSWRSKVMSRA